MKRVLAAAVAALASFALAGSAGATPTWSGDVLGLTYYYPDGSTVYQSQRTLSVGDTLSNIGYNGDYNGYTGTSLTLGATQISLDLSTGANPSLTPDPSAAFDGWVLTDLTNDPLITAVSVESETDFTLSADAITFTSNSISVNWTGDTMRPDSQLILNVTFDPPPADPVPEPASLALFGTALAGLGFLRRKSHKVA